jgi:hypothetical protein
MFKSKITLTILAPLILIWVGSILLVASIIYTSLISSVVGLGLVFWGVIFIYIRNEVYLRDILLDATVLPSLITIEQVLQELDWRGQGFHLPPKYIKNTENNRVYIAKTRNSDLPTAEYIRENENRLFINDLQGILLTSPGNDLVRIFEKTLGTSFIMVDLEYIKQNLPKLFIEDLDIARKIELTEKNSTISLHIVSSVYSRLNMETSKLPRVYETLGCPLVSAIASVIARATGKPVIIADQKIDKSSKALIIKYRIVEN